jgi:hypothetical protein
MTLGKPPVADTARALRILQESCPEVAAGRIGVTQMPNVSQLTSRDFLVIDNEAVIRVTDEANGLTYIFGPYAASDIKPSLQTRVCNRVHAALN